MLYSKLVVSCACLLLLHLEMGAARATNNGPSEALYALARDLGLGDDGLEYIWRTGMPRVHMANYSDGPIRETTVTYTLGPDRRTINKAVKITGEDNMTNWNIPNPFYSSARS